MKDNCQPVWLGMLLALVAVGCTRDAGVTDQAADEAKLELSGTTASFLPASDRLLTAAEEEAVLREIDNICGDTWCEGDFDFAFRTLDCKRSTHECVFKFDFLHRVYASGEDEPTQTFHIPAECTFADIRSPSDVIETERGRITYTDRLYDLVNACISEREPAARREAQKLERSMIIGPRRPT
jgi:hypothetical protein